MKTSKHDLKSYHYKLGTLTRYSMQRTFKYSSEEDILFLIGSSILYVEKLVGTNIVILLLYRKR